MDKMFFHCPYCKTKNYTEVSIFESTFYDVFKCIKCESFIHEDEVEYLKENNSLTDFKQEDIKMAWSYNAEDLNTEIGSGDYLDKSGCYKAKIVEIEEKKTTNGASQVILKLDVEGKETTIFHTFTKIDGTVIDFKIRHLNHLLFINKLTDPSKLKTLEGKMVGVMLKAKLSQDKKFINFDIDGFYHLETGKTAKELKDKLDAKVVKEMAEKYNNEKPLERVGGTTEKANTTQENVEVSDKEFPF